MQIVLLKKIKTLGIPGEVKDVKRGYAVNFLIPEGLALPATTGFIKEAQSRARKLNRETIVDTEGMKKLIEEISGLELLIKAKVNKSGNLFASIKSSDIAEEIAKKLNKGIDEDYIVLKTPIKKAGEYEIDIKAGDAKGKIKVKVEGE